MLKLKNANALCKLGRFYKRPCKRIKLYEDLKEIKNLYNINRAGTDCATHAGLLASESIISGDKDKFELLTNPGVLDPWKTQ